MIIRHGNHEHDVQVLDNGTLDTLIKIDETEITYEMAERDEDGTISEEWLKDVTRDACVDGLLEGEE